MGCGSSSLKGEAPNGLNAEPTPQIKKVNTNFSTINYDANDSKKRRNTEYAPHETVRQQSSASGIDPGQPMPVRRDTADDIGPDGEKLEPYHTIGDGLNAVELKDRSYPHETAGTGSTSQPENGLTNGDDPTSSRAKDTFASTNDPINNQEGSSSLAPPQGDEKKKRGSWIDKLRGGEQREISDEEMKKYTGKTKAEMTEFMQKGEGVGSRQGARNYAVGGADGGGAASGF